MKRFKLMYASLAIVLVFGVVIGGLSCAKPSPQKEISVLVAGPPAVWGSYPVIVSTSDLVTRQTNLNLTVRSYGGLWPIVAGLVAKEADIAGGIADAYWAMTYEAYGDRQGEPPVKSLRTLLALTRFRRAFVTPSSSNIQSIPDLKGKRVGRATTLSNLASDAILKAYGLDREKDITEVSMPELKDLLEAIRMGRMDCMFFSLRGADTMELAEAVGSLRVLPLEPDKFAWIEQNEPLSVAGKALEYLKPGWQPYLDITEPVPVLSEALMVTSREDVSEDIAYTYVKTLLDNINEVREMADMLAEFGPELIQWPSALPYHKGAIKALKEAKLWNKEMDDAHKAALEKAK